MMANKLDTLIARIHSIKEDYCQNQIYAWPGFNPLNDEPKAFCEQEGLEFDGTLFIRYPVKRTFSPIAASELKGQQRRLGASLPSDYLRLLEKFGQFHLPGKESFALESPLSALKTTRGVWWFDDSPSTVLAISWFNEHADGNSIGFIREGETFAPAIYKFDHELRHQGDDPHCWSTKASDSLTDFLLAYLSR